MGTDGQHATFYKTTLFWQWMRLPGDVVFALGAVLMAVDFIITFGRLTE